MLAAVLSLFLIFSVSGVAVMNLTSFTATESQKATQIVENQVLVESCINRALWMINNGLADQVNSIEGSVAVTYDSNSATLTATTQRFDQDYGVTVDLANHTHFDYTLATKEDLTDNNTTTLSEEEIRFFDFMPEGWIYSISPIAPLRSIPNRTVFSAMVILVKTVFIFLRGTISNSGTSA